MTQKQLLAWAVSGTLMFAGLGCANNCRQCSAHKHKDKEEHEEKVAVDSLPGAVVDGVKNSMPDGKITDAEKEHKHGKIVYELDVQSAGTTYEVKVGEDGKVLSKKLDNEEKEDHKDKGEKDKD